MIIAGIPAQKLQGGRRERADDVLLIDGHAKSVPREACARLADIAPLIDTSSSRLS
jgi:hypothetical protein